VAVVTLATGIVAGGVVLGEDRGRPAAGLSQPLTAASLALSGPPEGIVLAAADGSGYRLLRLPPGDRADRLRCPPTAAGPGHPGHGDEQLAADAGPAGQVAGQQLADGQVPVAERLAGAGGRVADVVAGVLGDAEGGAERRREPGCDDGPVPRDGRRHDRGHGGGARAGCGVRSRRRGSSARTS
jgi:hypothetical protein